MPYNSYDINFYTLAHWYTPRWLRKEKFIILIKACVYPLVLIHNTFIRYRKAKLYELKINYQVCYLEAFLNDRFDFTNRGIYIDDVVLFTYNFLYTRAETQPLWLYQRAENNPVVTYLRGEIMGAFTYDFIIYIPVGVVYDEAEVRAMMANNLSGKRFKIELY